MAASVLHLLESLETHLERTKAELKKLRQENAWLKQQLAAQQHQKDDTPVPQAPLAVPKPEKVSQDTEQAQSAAPSPQALLNQWYQRYPKAFFKGHTKPLKIGIHHDLAQREPWSGKLIRRALANYVNLPRYVKSMREGAERFDLDGNPVGKVDKEASLHATQRRKERPTNEIADGSQKKAAKQENEATIASSITAKETAGGEAAEFFNKQAFNKQAFNKRTFNKHSGKSDKGASSHQLAQSERAKPLSLEEKLKGLQQKFEGQ